MGLDNTRTLIIGTDILQCEKCQEWYEPKIGHLCDLSVKSTAAHSRMRRAIQRDMQEIMDGIARIGSGDGR